MADFSKVIKTIKSNNALITLGARLGDKRKPLYLYSKSAYGTKVGRLITYVDKLLLIKSYDLLIT